MAFEGIKDLQQRLANYVGDIDPEDPKGRKRRRILEAATALFIAQGYRKTNIDEIARAAGIAKGTVYLYFATKADVLTAAVAYEKQRSLSLLEGVFDEGLPARERLRRWVRAALQMVVHSPLLSRLTVDEQDLRAGLMDVHRELAETSIAEHNEFLSGLLDEAALPRRWSDAERKERIAALYALMQVGPMIGRDHFRQGVDVDRLADVIASVIVDGITQEFRAAVVPSHDRRADDESEAARRGEGS